MSHDLNQVHNAMISRPHNARALAEESNNPTAAHTVACPSHLSGWRIFTCYDKLLLLLSGNHERDLSKARNWMRKLCVKCAYIIDGPTDAHAHLHLEHYEKVKACKNTCSRCDQVHQEGFGSHNVKGDSSKSEEELSESQDGAGGGSASWYYASDSDDEEMLSTFDQISNAIEINDWVNLLDSFDKLGEQLEKASRAYNKALVLVGGSLARAFENKEAKKKILNSMKHKLKKNNKIYEEFIAKYRENQVEESDDEQSDIEGKYSQVEEGKKGMSWLDQVDQSTHLSLAAKTPAQKLDVLFNLISAQFDVNPSLLGHMPVGMWKQCISYMLHVLGILKMYPNIVVDESVQPTDEKESQKGADFKGTIRVWGNLVAIVERLNSEFFKSLQGTDPHTKDYAERLRDEPLFMVVAQNVQEYLEQINDFKSAARVALQRVAMVYYKPQEVYCAMRNQTTREDEPTLTYPESSRKFMDNLVSMIYEYGDEMTKARAALCNIYHHAILDEYPAARDLLLTSNLQDGIQSMDASSKILFHRAMAQLGLCAFRAGLVSEAHECLTELYESGPVRENLAQGVSHSLCQEKTPEQEKAEQMPYHMHINVELLEATHLTCALLAERPYVQMQQENEPLKSVRETFRCLVEISERQAFVGPPENVRDHIMAVTRALTSDDFRDSFEGVVLKFKFGYKDALLNRFKENIKEEALIAYALSNLSCYESIGWDQLATMFDLREQRVLTILIGDLRSTWDYQTRRVLLRYVEPTRS